MLKSLTVSFLIGCAALFGWPTSPVAQTEQEVAPVPGPYRAAPAPRAVTANRPTAQPMRQMMPYWMRPTQPPAGWMSPRTAQRQQQFIPGWVWSPSAPNPAQRSNRQVQRPMPVFGYQNGPRNPYFGPAPMRQQMPPWQQYRGQSNRPNTPYGAPPQYGGQQQHRQQYRQQQYQTPSN